MKKRIISAMLTCIITLTLVACSSNSANVTTNKSTETKDNKEETSLDTKKTYELSFVIPGTDSQYWNQYCGTGVDNAIIDIEEKYDVTINKILTGPAAEGATDEYLNILEGVIAKKPDVIITATMEGEGTAPIIKEAAKEGIFVNMFSLGIIDGYEEYYGALYYCDQPEQGKIAAEEIIRQLKEKNIPLKGYIGMHLATSTPVLEEKMQTFLSRMAELAPDIKVLGTLYNQNDVNTAQANVENQISAYGDELIGLFGGNNLSGDGIVLAVKNAGIAAKIASVAVDSDDIEITGLKEGNLGGIIVQTPYDQAYHATYDALAYVIDGNEITENAYNYPADVVTLANMDETEYAALLDPTILAYKK